MSGFQHDIAGGNGNLVITSVQSPNFVHGVSGWKIAKDGSAEFQDVIIPAGSGGTVVTFSSTQPSSPNVGDVWYDTSSGLKAHVWNGTAFVAFFIGGSAIGGASITGGNIAANTITASNIVTATITAAKIAANTITAAQLAAGIVYAGIVDATTITGAAIIADGTSGNFLVYSGTPATGNLTASISPVSGTDAHSNAFNAGVWAYNASGSAGIQGDSLIIKDTSGDEWELATEGALSGDLLFSSLAGGDLWLANTASPYWITQQPGSTNQETWHTLTLKNGWTASATVRYKLMPDNSAWVIGAINSAAMTSTTWGTLPAGYVPAVGGDAPVAAHSATPPTQGCFLRLDTSGNLIALNSTTGSGILSVNMRIPMD